MLRNDAQKKAIEHPGGPLLIVAGAGTGKTTVIVDRLLWLLREQGAKPEELLALTFTEKATEEMIDRVDKQIEYGYTQLWISTFHAFCERVLHDHALDIGIPHEFKLLNTVDAWVLMRRNFDRFDLNYYRPLGNPAKFIKALIQHFSRCKDEAITPENYLEYAKNVALDSDSADGIITPLRPPLKSGGDSAPSERARLEELANAYHTYQQLLLDNAALDFGDLMLYTLRLFQERPAVLLRYQSQFTHILVDEFQDTNWIQYAIVKLLASPRNNLTVVADDDQSIYAWRGASMSNILQFKKDYPDAASVVLTENYRSRQNILDHAYTFIQKNNPNRLEVQLAAENLSKQLIAARGGEAPIELIHAATEADEGRQVAEKILALRSDARNPMHWSDIAVLVRANRHADAFVRAFDTLGIPYRFLASKGLYAKPVVLDCIAYLKLCDNYHESPAFYRVLTSPVVALHELDIVRLMHEAGKKNASLFSLAEHPETLELSEDARGKLRTVVGWIERHTGLARTKSVGEVLYAFLEDSGYMKTLTKSVQHTTPAPERDWERVRHLEQFFGELIQFEHTEAEPTVQRFLELLRVREEAGDEGALDATQDASPDAVQIMTIHGSKGLEFRYVFIAQLVELRFPSVGRKDPIDIPTALVKEILPEGDTHLEEERRLMYVAMTRARDGLFFSYADDYGGTRKKRASVFLVELGLVTPPEKRAVQKSTQQELAGIGASRSMAEPRLATHPFALPERFSYSQLKAFDTCPLQYKFSHILRIPIKGKFSMNFGKSVHAALERFFALMMERAKSEQGGLFAEPGDRRLVTGDSSAPTLQELLTLYEESWIGEWYESKKHEKEYFEQGKAILKAFYALHKNAWPTVIAVEQPFTMKVGTAIIKGKIDRIDRASAGVRIVDYKTGNQPKAIDKRQLILYQLALEQTTDTPVDELVYYYLTDQESRPFVAKDKEKEKTEAWVRDTIEAIRSSDFTPTPSPMVCRNCDFRDICEYKQL